MLRRAISRMLLCATLVIFCAASPATAQETIDFDDFNCGDFIDMLNTASEEDGAYIFMWLDGYLSGVTGDTVINWRGMERFGEDLATFCMEHPQSPLLDAARAVGVASH